MRLICIWNGPVCCFSYLCIFPLFKKQLPHANEHINWGRFEFLDYLIRPGHRSISFLFLIKTSSSHFFFISICWDLNQSAYSTLGGAIPSHLFERLENQLQSLTKKRIEDIVRNIFFESQIRKEVGWTHNIYTCHISLDKNYSLEKQYWYAWEEQKKVNSKSPFYGKHWFKIVWTKPNLSSQFCSTLIIQNLGWLPTETLDI